MRLYRHLVPTLLLAAFFFVVLPGCMLQNLTPTTQLRNQVDDLNDETRWARIDLAVSRVSPDYRAEFLVRHQSWGHDVQVADIDLSNIQMAEDSESADAVMTISWYDRRTMEAYSTIVRQHWLHVDRAFVLGGEEVMSGEDGLLPPLETEEDADAQSGDEASAEASAEVSAEIGADAAKSAKLDDNDESAFSGFAFHSNANSTSSQVQAATSGGSIGAAADPKPPTPKNRRFEDWVANPR